MGAGIRIQPCRVNWTAGWACALLVAAGCDLQTPAGKGGGSAEGPGGRQQPLALNPRQELSLGREAYDQVSKEYRGKILPKDSRETERVRRIMARIAKAAEIEPLQREIGLRIRGYVFEWEANVVREEQVNAFCLPGGKVFVFTGILPVAGDSDDQLAAVVSHEIAHALAHHSSERLAREQGGEGTFGKLRYDRMQESEADHVGVFLMAFADYNPDDAVRFWQRMRQAAGGRGRPPEILSDHPSDERRVRDLQEWAPKAKAAKKAFDQGRIAPSGR